MIRNQRGTYCHGFRYNLYRPRPTYSPATLVLDTMIALNAIGLRGLNVRDENVANEAASALLRSLGVEPSDLEEETS